MTGTSTKRALPKARRRSRFEFASQQLMPRKVAEAAKVWRGSGVRGSREVREFATSRVVMKSRNRRR